MQEVPERLRNWYPWLAPSLPQIVQELFDALIQILGEILQDTIHHIISNIPHEPVGTIHTIQYQFELLQWKENGLAMNWNMK